MIQDEPPAQPPDSGHAPETGAPASPDGSEPTRDRHPVLRWGERILWVVLLVVLAEQLGPRVAAWTGIGPSFAPVETFSGGLPPALTLQGEPVDVPHLADRVRVVTFWATWCRVCGWELPALDRLHRELADDGVVVMALSIDREGPGVVRAYREERGLELPMAMAAAGSREALGGIPGVPTTFIIDPDGRIRHRVVGASGPGTLRRAVDRLVEEYAP